jgi:hypothetical protein
MKDWMKIGLAVIFCICVFAVLYFIAQSTPIIKKKDIALTVIANEGSFEIICMDAIQIKAGENAGMTVSVQPQQGFNKAVKFTMMGGPAGMVVDWANADDTWDAGQTTGNLQCNISIPLDNGLVGQYALILQGTSQ